MDKKYLSATEVSEMLQLNEKKIYKLAQEGKIPATKITGKWLFPAEELEQFINQNALNNLSERYKSHTAGKILLFAGSDDPLLQILIGSFNQPNQNTAIFYSKTGSYKGLSLVKNGLCHVALCHILNSETGNYNIDYIKHEIHNHNNFTVINLFKRDIGFISKNDYVHNFREISDKKLRFINRSKSTGTRALADMKLLEENLSSADIVGYENEATSHFETAELIIKDLADVGISTRFFCEIFNLKFYKLTTENFDMVLRKEIFFTEEFQKFLNFIRSSKVIDKICQTEGYSSVSTGNIVN